MEICLYTFQFSSHKHKIHRSKMCHGMYILIMVWSFFYHISLSWGQGRPWIGLIRCQQDIQNQKYCSEKIKTAKYSYLSNKRLEQEISISHNPVSFFLCSQDLMVKILTYNTCISQAVGITSSRRAIILIVKCCLESENWEININNRWFYEFWDLT